MRFIKSIVLSVGIVHLFAPLVPAQECPNPTPTDSPIWRDFNRLVDTEYSEIRGPGPKIPADSDYYFEENRSRLLVMGHALGRLASAVQNDPGRRSAFACVQLAIEQLAVLAEHPLRTRGLLRDVMEAALGMKDAEIARLTGVRSAEPLYDLFGGKLEDPGAASSPTEDSAAGAQAPETIVKQDPAAVGGPVSQTVSASGLQTGPGSSLGGHCSNWIVSNLKDQSGRNQATETQTACTILGNSGDFISRYESTTQSCLLCAREDWTLPGATATARSGGETHQACADASTPSSASWLFYGRGGGGNAEYFEKGGAICNYPSSGYTTYSGSQMKSFTCEKGYANCQPGTERPITKVEPKAEYTVYWFGTGTSRGHRTPTGLGASSPAAQATAPTSGTSSTATPPSASGTSSNPGARSGAGSSSPPGTSSSPSRDGRNERAAHIRYWLANAHPLENARSGYGLRYDEWGRLSGPTPTGTVRLSGAPDGAGADSTEYAWQRADILGSLNLCTLRTYVESKLAGREPEGCRMTIPTPPPARRAAAGAIPDVIGLVAPQARTQFDDLGVGVTWRAGSVSDDPTMAGRVERQSPEPGTTLAGVQAAELWVARAGTATVEVPDVTGMQYDLAAERLRRVGLTPQRDVSRSTAPQGQGGAVAAQGVKPGERVAPGATVRLDVYESGEQVGSGKPVQIKPQVIRPDANSSGPTANIGNPGGSVNPNLPERFDCETGIASLPQNHRRTFLSDSKGQGGVTVKDGVLAGYACEHLVAGQRRSVVVSFFIKEPPTDPTYRGRKGGYCVNARHGNYGAGRAIEIFTNSNAAMPQFLGPAVAKQVYDFHTRQVAPYAIQCDY